jgi:hypothetical protein
MGSRRRKASPQLHGAGLVGGHVAEAVADEWLGAAEEIGDEQVVAAVPVGDGLIVGVDDLHDRGVFEYVPAVVGLAVKCEPAAGFGDGVVVEWF